MERQITIYTEFYERDGRKEWKYQGSLHRRNGPAVVWDNGAYEYYILGNRHREDGPARLLPSGIIEYYQFGNLHREDGPAVIYPTGEEEYWLRGKHFTKEEYYNTAYWVNTGVATREEFELIQ